jgi:hypothetical protein
MSASNIESTKILIKLKIAIQKQDKYNTYNLIP